MPRKPRTETPGSIYHVTVRGNQGHPVFTDTADGRSFLAVLGDVTRTEWTLLSYCLMPNHVHLLLRLGSNGMSSGMNRLLGTHAARFNAVHDRTGHLFGERYHSTEVVREEHLEEVFRYIAMNPCRAGLVGSPERWDWSAHRALIGRCPPAAGLDRNAALAYFEPPGYASFVLDAPDGLAQLLESRYSNPLHRALARGYTQADLASFLRVSQATVSRRLRAERCRCIKGG